MAKNSISAVMPAVMTAHRLAGIMMRMVQGTILRTVTALIMMSVAQSAVLRAVTIRSLITMRMVQRAILRTVISLIVVCMVQHTILGTVNRLTGYADCLLGDTVSLIVEVILPFRLHIQHLTGVGVQLQFIFHKIVVNFHIVNPAVIIIFQL